MRLSRIAAAVALIAALAAWSPSLAASEPCGGSAGSDNPCLEEYYARYCSNDCYRDEESHPFRVIAYLLNPVGVALEWAIFRPLHWAVSRESTAPIFGHSCEYDY